MSARRRIVRFENYCREIKQMSVHKVEFTAEIPPQGIPAENIRIVGEVPVTDKPGGEVVGTAKMEKTRSGSLVAHVTMSPEHEHLIGVGFKLGDFSLVEEE